MRSKDHYGNDQLSGQQVQDSLRQAGIKLDRSLVSRMMKAADIIGRGIYSIPGLMDLITRALRSELRDSAHARRHRPDTSKSCQRLGCGHCLSMMLPLWVTI